MRPDDHKKRKNTQYKKKHGINSDGKEQASGKEGEKNTKGVKPSNLKKDDEGHTRLGNRTHEVSTDDLTAEDAGEFSYSKRKLVSNWSRYEDLPSDDEDDLPAQRGEDFNKLLAEAGGSAAQFRFKDEEDWSGLAEPDAGPGVLALDFEEIARSLTCLPLHERLGISRDLFTAEQLEEIEALANDNQSKYEASEVGATRMKNPSGLPSHKGSDRQLKASKSEHLNNNLTLKQEFVTDKNMHADSERAKGKSCNRTVDIEKSNAPVKSAEIKHLEDDLDLLLSMDEPVKESAKTVPTGLQSDSGNTEGERQPAKDDSKVVKPASVIKAQTKEDNLEDWLDSMLD